MKNKKSLLIDEAAMGMTLAQDVVDINGVCLVAVQTTLTVAMLDSLKRRGVKSLIVWEEQELSDEEFEEEQRAQREAWSQALEHRFRQVADDANMRCLKDILLAYRLQGLS